MRIRRLLLSLALLLPIIWSAASDALAACLDPDRPEGSIVYNASFNVPQYCNGTDWIAFGALNPAAGGGGCTDPTATEGKIAYNTNYHVLQYCDGDDWRTVGSGKLHGGSGFLSFAGLTDQSPSTLVSSGILQVLLQEGSAAISIAGNGSPQYRICADAACGVETQSWTNGALSIDDGAFLQLRLTSDASFGGTRNATITVGTASDAWDVSTAGQDTTPDTFNFSDQTNVAQATLTSSNTVTITGINDTASVSVSGDGSPQVSINGGGWVTSGTIASGQTLQLRLTSGGFSETRVATVTVGGGSDQWSVSTGSQDTTPDPFTFTDQTNVALNTLTTSNSINITGIAGGVSVSVSGAGSPQFSIAGGAWTTSGTITNGQSLQLRLTSNAAQSTANVVDIMVGTASDNWSVTTNNYPYFTGGSVVENGGYRIHTFTTSGTLTMVAPGDVEYLVVAGGGGGGRGQSSGTGGGGGGAGGMLTGTVAITTTQTITIGGGGTAAATFGTNGGNGANSSIGNLVVATGGGGGGGTGTGPGTGGSGGGGRGVSSTNPQGRLGVAGIAGQGKTGGNGIESTSAANRAAGGGGGKATAGLNGVASAGGDGGSGQASSISGSSVTYAGGGGGGHDTDAGAGGTGGGGSGATANSAAVAGTANRGGGGGGGYTASADTDAGAKAAAAGGSGIVIIRYPI
ncbi:MAG: hypothetical protein J0H94_09125 [Rhizobiales bacterium]|nr:hypothetical protein [Hyphomicrobiales bacterium]